MKFREEREKTPTEAAQVYIKKGTPEGAKGDEMNIKIYFNRAFKSSANLIALETKCSYFNLTDDELIIDGKIAANQLTLKKINSIEFITGGYKSSIAVKEHEQIKSSIYNYNNFAVKRNLEDVIYFIKEI